MNPNGIIGLTPSYAYDGHLRGCTSLRPPPTSQPPGSPALLGIARVSAQTQPTRLLAAQPGGITSARVGATSGRSSVPKGSVGRPSIARVTQISRSSARVIAT